MIGYPKPPKTKRKSRTKVWNKIRRDILKPMFADRGITYCEVTKYEYEQGNITQQEAQKRNWALSFHHRHKRDWYKRFKRETEERLLGEFDQVLLVGQHYHSLLEADADLTAHYFEVLRGQEHLPKLQDTHD